MPRASGRRPSGARAVARCDLLGVGIYSDLRGGLFRPFLGPGHMAASERVGSWMREAGMATRIDAAGTLVGRYEGAAAGLPALLIGSHLDSVRDGGRYDGALGVLLGIECVASLSARGERMPFPIEVVAFGDEEGSRFPISMLGSRAMAGKLQGPTADLTNLTDPDGITLKQAFATAGLDIGRISDAVRPPETVLAYLEAHIEQGPVLDLERQPVAVVEAIAGIERFEVTLSGRAGHAGTVPMGTRIDALAAASEVVLAIEAIGRQGAPDLVCTVGALSVSPGAVNVIPGQVMFSVEVRSGSAPVLDHALSGIEAALLRISGRRGVVVTPGARQRFEPARCDAALSALLDEGLADLGLAPRRLVSFAGHDGMMLADRMPSAMLFIRCEDGISHHPAEAVAVADVQVALDVMLTFIDRLRGSGREPVAVSGEPPRASRCGAPLAPRCGALRAPRRGTSPRRPGTG